MKRKENKNNISKLFQKRELPLRIKQISFKGILATGLLATGFAPTVQAYEEGKRSGVVSVDTGIQPLGFDPLETDDLLGGTEYDKGLETRRSKIERVGELGKSEKAVAIEHMKKNIGTRKDFADYEDILSEGILEQRGDKASLALGLTAGEVASSSFIQMTIDQPMVLSLYDPENDLGTIILVESNRNSDGSATMYQRFVSPYNFEKESDGGSLSDSEYRNMISQYGDNPAEKHKNTGKYKHSFTSITENGLLTMAGLVMQNNGATFGLHSSHILDQDYWKTKSGKIRVKITHHLLTEVDPQWSMLLPRDEVEGGFYPFFTLNKDNGDKVIVNGGINVIQMDDFASSFDLDNFEIDYRKKKESGWSGIAMAIFSALAVVAVVATGGAFGLVLGSLNAGTAGAITFGVVGGVSLASGTLTDKTTTSVGNITSVTSESSTKANSGFFEKPKNVARDIVLNGALHSSAQKTAENNNSAIESWSHKVDPLYTTSLGNNKYEYKGTNLHKQVRPEEDEMFDNINDNPDYMDSDICNGGWSGFCYSPGDIK